MNKMTFSEHSAILLGSGRMGQRYIKILSQLGIPLLAVCDQNPAALANAQELCPQAKAFSDPELLFREYSASFVIIASTAPSHHELTILAANSGAKLILCEKPMAVSISQAEDMIEICAQKGIRLAVNHQMRFMQQYLRPKSLITSEEFGGLCSFNVIAGNFGLTMNGSHYIEALRFLSDSEPISVAAWLEDIGSPNPRGSQFKDMAGIIKVETKNSIRMYLDCSASQGFGMQAIYACRFGQIWVDEAFGELKARCRKQSDRSLPTTRIVTDPEVLEESLQPAEVLESSLGVVQALLTNGTYCDGEQALNIIRTLVAIYISSEQNNRTVLLTEELPRDRIFPWA